MVSRTQIRRIDIEPRTGNIAVCLLTQSFDDRGRIVGEIIQPRGVIEPDGSVSGALAELNGMLGEAPIVLDHASLLTALSNTFEVSQLRAVPIAPAAVLPYVDRIEIVPETGHVLVRLLKTEMTSIGGKVSRTYHRTSIEPDGSPSDQMMEVKRHLQTMGFTLTDDEAALVDSVISAAPIASLRASRAS